MRALKRLLSVSTALLLLFTSVALLCLPTPDAPVFTQKTSSRSYLSAARDGREMTCIVQDDTPRVERGFAQPKDAYRALATLPTVLRLVLACASLLRLASPSALGVFLAGKHIQRAPPRMYHVRSTTASSFLKGAYSCCFGVFCLS